MFKIAFRKGYKYQLAVTFEKQIDIRPPVDIVTDFILLTKEGLLCLKSGYAWDGPSGPTIDRPPLMKGSLVHDALYQLMRLGELDHIEHRKTADVLFRDICRGDGLNPVSAWIVYQAVRLFGGPHASPENRHEICMAP